MASKITKHLIIDIKTGYAYGLKLDEKGACLAVQPLNSAIEKFDGTVVDKFGPLIDAKAPGAKDLPYGKTIYAVEMGKAGEKGQIFTITFPKEADVKKGIMPIVAHKDLPDNLEKAGVAAKALAAKGSGVDDENALKEALKNIDDMIGLDSAKRDIKQNISIARFNKVKQEMGLQTKPIARHMVFTGTPGTGKTTFAREVAKVYHALGFIEKPEVTEVKREHLVAGFVGQTALKTAEVIEKAKGGILFIDEAYALSRSPDGKDFGIEAIDTLVAAMENMRDDLVVIVAGYPEPMKRFIDANEGLKSRFTTYISFEDYTVPQLGQILDFMLQDRGYKMDDDAREAAMKLIENDKKRAGDKFGNGRIVRNLVEAAEKKLAARLEDENVLIKNHGMTDSARKDALTRFKLADVASISLDGINSKPVRIGFGEVATKKADNDNPQFSTPPALEQASTGKKKIQPGFLYQ